MSLYITSTNSGYSNSPCGQGAESDANDMGEGACSGADVGLVAEIGGGGGVDVRLVAQLVCFDGGVLTGWTGLMDFAS
ncbi:hypothetical protein QVD17_27967 [Tagetes erecta]|uniref:Uncharacterized protein n=1 Tax=Tagetes erecta TaxID=13708 RepID=A0AAD8K9I9_TARER|nr:hypothetical protein QVD17_27967 [Tagetes erecta]